MSETVIQRMARAMMEHMFAPHELPVTNAWLIERYEDCARAVLTSISEPSAKMVEAAIKSMQERQNMLLDEAAAHLWRAMVQAALKEGEGNG